jgi:hypothetical protein
LFERGEFSLKWLLDDREKSKAILQSATFRTRGGEMVKKWSDM